jgi:hypothetical protein
VSQRLRQNGCRGSIDGRRCNTEAPQPNCGALFLHPLESPSASRPSWRGLEIWSAPPNADEFPSDTNVD